VYTAIHRPFIFKRVDRCINRAEENIMRRLSLVVTIAIAMYVAGGRAQSPSGGPYKVLKTAKVGGTGGFDYVYADVAARRLYIPRGGVPATATAPAIPGRITVFDLDTLAPVGEIANTRGNGAAVDPNSGHGFASSKPVAMWDTRTLALIKTIDVQGNPDGILFDPFNDRVYVFSHAAPHTTVIDAKDGSVLGTIDLGGAPEQAVTDGKGRIYVDVSDKANVAVIDAKTMSVTAHYDLGGAGEGLAGLALDDKNHVLFVACRLPAPGVMVMLNADTGKVLSTLPLAGSSDGAVFNPQTQEAFSSSGQGDGTLTIVKENGATSFEVEQNLKTMSGAKTLTLDSKTNHVLLIGADYVAAPPPATPPPAGGRGPARTMVPDSFSIVVVGK
jgi:DNA-binding beta-propeller fold protein YncE